MDSSEQAFEIKIDSSKCISVIEGCACLDKIYSDSWRYTDLTFESGKIYGLVSEYQQGGMYVSYLIGGKKESFDSVAEKFFLTPQRYKRKLKQLSGERWRASAALGYALGKKIFYAPYECSEFYYQMCHSGLDKVLRELTINGALVLLPVGSDAFIKELADECVYLKRTY